MPSFSSGVPLLRLVRGEGEGEAISSFCSVWVRSLSSTPFVNFQCLFLPLHILETLFCGWEQLSDAAQSQDKN
jgi:hypothetical protein